MAGLVITHPRPRARPLTSQHCIAPCFHINTLHSRQIGTRQSMQYWIGPMNYFMLASRGCFIQDKSTWYYTTTLCACFGWIIIVKLLRWIDLKSRYYILHTPSISSLHMRGGSPVEQVTILCQTACLCYCDSQGSGY